MAPAFRGRRLAAAALRLAGGWLFDACGLARLELLTEPDNRAMIAAAQDGRVRRTRGSCGPTSTSATAGWTSTILSLLPADLR